MGRDSLEALKEKIRRLERDNARISKQLSDTSWEKENRRDYEQEERSRWGIYG